MLLIALLIAHIALGLLATTITLPSMQQWGGLFQADQAAVQLTFSAYALTYGGMQLIYGPLSDRLGRKRPLLAGMALFIVASMLAASARSLEVLTLARALQGAGAAAGIVIARSLVQDIFQGAQRTRVLAYIGMTMGLCPPAGAIVGGQLHVWLGWQANFVLMAGLALGLWIMAWRILPDRRSSQGANGPWLAGMLGGYATLLRSSRFVLHAAIVGLTTACFFVYLSGAPTVLGAYGVGPAGVGWYIALVPLAYFVGNFTTSRLAGRLKERRIMAIGQALSLAGPAVVVLVVVLTGIHSPLAFALPLVLLGLGHGLLMPVAMGATVGLLPALAGSAAAVAGASQQLIGSLGAYGVGWLDLGNPVPLCLMMMAVTSSAIVANTLLGRLPPQPPQPSS